MYGYGFQYSKIDSGANLGKIIFEAYQVRVLAASGVVENNSCTIAFLNNLQ